MIVNITYINKNVTTNVTLSLYSKHNFELKYKCIKI